MHQGTKHSLVLPGSVLAGAVLGNNPAGMVAPGIPSSGTSQCHQHGTVQIRARGAHPSCLHLPRSVGSHFCELCLFCCVVFSVHADASLLGPSGMKNICHHPVHHCARDEIKGEKEVSFHYHSILSYHTHRSGLYNTAGLYNPPLLLFYLWLQSRTAGALQHQHPAAG